MMKKSTTYRPQFGRINSIRALGNVIRAFRKNRGLTLEKVSALSHLSMRFLSELERGKQTAELGKTLTALNRLGLEMIILPRGYDRQLTKLIQQEINDDQP